MTTDDERKPMTPAAWLARADAVTDAELADFRRNICVGGGHIGLAAIGTCSRCGGATSSCSMAICQRCATELGVCPFDQRMTASGSVSAPDEDAITTRWLALLMRGYSTERAAAQRALATFPLPGLDAAARDLDMPAGTPTRSPAPAEFIVGFRGELPDGLEEGSAFLNGTVVRLSPGLRFAVVHTGDAVRFEAQAADDPRIQFIELNAPGG